MNDHRKAIYLLAGAVVFLFVFFVGFFILYSDLQKSKNLRLEESLKTAIAEKAIMANKLTHGEEEKQTLREQIASVRKELSTCSRSKAALGKHGEQLYKLVVACDEQIRQLIEKNKFLQSNGIELTAKLEETLVRNRALQKMLSAMKMEISALKQKLQQKEALISEKTIEADMADAEVEGLQSDLAALEEKAEQDQAGFKENKLQLARKLEQNEISLKTMSAKLAERKNDIALLVGDNARSRRLLKEKVAQLAKIQAGVKRLSDAVANLSPRLITKINFATGEWRLNANHKAILDAALKKMRGYSSGFIGLVKGSSDPQSFPDNSDHKNLKLSTLRALSVESYLLRKPEGIPPVAIMGLGKIFAPTEPANNQAERTAAVFIIKKNPPDLDGLMADLRRCLREN